MIDKFIKIVVLALVLIGCQKTVPPPAALAKPVSTVLIQAPSKPVPMKKAVLWRPPGAISLVEAKRTNRITVLVFTSQDCTPCTVMKETTFSDDKVIDLLNNNFVPVLLEGEKYLELLDSLEFERSWPTVIFLTSEGELIDGFQGYVPPEMLQTILNIMHE